MFFLVDRYTSCLSSLYELNVFESLGDFDSELNLGKEIMYLRILTNTLFINLFKTLSSPLVRASLMLSALNTLALSWPFGHSPKSFLSIQYIMTSIRLACLDFSALLTWSLGLLIIKLLIETLYNLLSFKASSQYLLGLGITALNAFYMFPDWGGASHKLSLALGDQALQTWLQTFIVFTLCVSPLLVTLALAKLRTPVQKRLLILGTLSIWGFNESVLEGAYFGIHFYLSTLCFQSLFLYFELNQTAQKSISQQVQVNESLQLASRQELKLQNLTSKSIHIAFLLVLCMSFGQSTALFASQHDLRQRYNRAETAVALKAWSYFNPTHTLRRVPDSKQTLNSPWLDGQRLQSLQNTWRAPLDLLPKQIQDTNMKAIVILLTIDSLKSEWFTQKRTPSELKQLKALSTDPSTWFSPNIFSASTSTRFTLGSFIFGRYPSHLTWSRDQATHPSLSQEQRPNLWAHLAQQQVNTVYFASDPAIIRKSNGLGRDLKKIIKVPARSGFKVAFSQSIIDRLITELDQAGQKQEATLLFSHLLDAHHPFNGGRRIYKNKIKSHLAELALIDEQITRLLKVIQTHPAKDRIWLIISSDHGQGFGRHHVQTHNASPYEHQARVPIWIYHNQLAQLKTTQLKTSSPLSDSIQTNYIKNAWEKSRAWSSIDLHPTLLDIFAAPKNPKSQGVSWWPYFALTLKNKSFINKGINSNEHKNTRLQSWLSIESQALSQRPLLSLNWHSRALYHPLEHLKFIEETHTQTLMLFDLKKDPFERQNLCDQQSSKCQAKRQELNRLIYTQGRQPIEYNKRVKH